MKTNAKDEYLRSCCIVVRCEVENFFCRGSDPSVTLP